MATKTQELHGGGCFAKAELDEPLFVLRAKDPLASVVVRIWAQLALTLALHEPDKIAEAIVLAGDMDVWRKERFPPVNWLGPPR